MKNTTKLMAVLAFLTLAFVAINVYADVDIRPSRTSTAGSTEQLQRANPAFSNFVVDRPVLWLPLASTEVSVASLVGLGGGTPSLAEINTSEMAGFTLDADNESVTVLIPIPADIDLTEDIRLRGLWSNSEAAGTGTGQLKFVYEIYTASTTALAVANDACDSDGAAQTDLAANVVIWSNWSTIDGSTISATPGEDLMAIKVYADLTTIANMTVYGIQVQYYRKWLGGDNQ